ncbi:unnamed protein product, partial [Rotaria sordida]
MFFVGTVCQMTFRRLTKSSISLSSHPHSVAVGDFNNDNQIDVVVTNSDSNTIGIFLANNDGTFANQQTYSTGSESHPYSISVSDFNNDNYLDIAVANYGTHNIGIFIGYGNGTFHNQKTISTDSSRPLFITIGDFNKDTHLDIIVANNGTNSIGIFSGDGQGSFQLQSTYSTGYDSLPCSLAVGDFNKDNQLDIAVANYGTDNICIFLGYGNGTFASPKTYTTTHNSKPSSIVVADFNNDKQLDIAVTHYGTGNISIFLDYANGTFASQSIYSISFESSPHFIAVGHFDKDNHLDLAVADSENDQIHIIRGYGNGRFATLTTYDSITGSRPIAVAVTDFDKDNQSDIVVANNGNNNILILIGYYSKPSTRIRNYFVGHDSHPSSLVLYDFNYDGKLDIAVNSHNILIFTGIGDGTFVRGEEYSTGNQSVLQYLCVGDLNNDNRIDIVVANVGRNCIDVLFGQDNGTFSTIVTFSTGDSSTPWFVALSDVNNDNQLDMISANTGSGSIGIFLGYGNGTFANMETYSTGTVSNPMSLAVGYVNNDEHLDIVVAIQNPDSIKVFLGYGNGTFEIIMTYSFGINAQTFWVVLSELNRDNHLDIVVVSNNIGVSIFLGNGDGTFRTQVTYSTGSGASPYDAVVTDFNQDNYYDIVVTNGASNEVAILFGDGNGNFEFTQAYSTGLNSGPYGIAVEDLNNDKQLEIVVVLWGTDNVGVLTQYYAANFAKQAINPTGSALHPHSIAVGDFNRDNRSDIVVVNSGTDNLGIRLGSSNGTFGPNMMYSIATNAYPQYVITVDINKDKDLDIVVVNSRNSSISVIMGYGNGSFVAQTMYSTGVESRPYAIAVGDFNNDYQQDLVIANSGTDNIGIFFGHNYASFQDQKTYSNKDCFTPNDVVVGHFNNDNYLDIAVVCGNSNNLAILLGYDDGCFADMITYSTGSNSYPNSLAIGDFNNDDQMDIVVVNYAANNIGLFLNYGNGSFANMITYSTGDGSTPRSAAVGDLNNDNLTDIVAVNSGHNSIGIIIGYGNGNFDKMITYSTGKFSNPYAAAISDLNNDGRLDIAVVNVEINEVCIFIGYGNVSFAILASYSTGYRSNPCWIIINDFNNDNRSDIATANFNSNYIGILLGYGNGSYASVVTYFSGDNSSPECVSADDFNNDNILDIAVANSYSNNIVVLFGVGDGTFLLGKAYSTGTGSVPISLAIGDFDNDARLDIVVANFQSNNIGIFLGYSHEPFGDITNYPTGDGSQPHSVAVADFNKDGYSDIVVTNYGTDNIGIFLGFGKRIFSTMIIYSTGIGSTPRSAAVGDLNNDNLTDIV